MRDISAGLVSRPYPHSRARRQELLLVARRYWIAFPSLFLYLVLFGLSSPTAAQTTIVIYKAPNQPVKNVTVDLECGGEKRHGTADQNGVFKVDPPAGGQCDIRITGGTLTEEVRFFDYGISEGSENRLNIRLANRFAKEKRSDGDGNKSLLVLEQGTNKPVRGAEVVVDCVEDSPYGNSDAGGRFRFDSKGSNSCTYDVRHPDFEDAIGSLEIAANPRTAIFNVFLKKKKISGKSLAGEFSTLKVVDDKGAAVVPAEISIVCDGKTHSGYADRLGQFFFDTGGSLRCGVRVIHPDFYAYNGSIDTDLGPTHVVSLERTLASGITVTVLDEETGKPVAGVGVRIEGLSDSWVRTSDASGRAMTSTLVIPGTYRTTGRHPDYYDASSSFEVPRSVGKSFATTLSIKRKEHVKTIRVVVSESETDKPIGEASVYLTAGFFSGYSGTTGPDGVANITVNRAGRFNVEVTRDNYFPAKTVVSIEPGAQGNDLEFFVSMDKKRGEGGIYPVKVKVMGEKTDGTTSPLSGAVVSPGDGDGVTTGEDGWATVRFTGYSGDNSTIRVSRSGFEDTTVPFTVPRFASSVTAPEITVTLKEKLDRLVLRVEVSDRATEKKLRGAKVTLGTFGTATTNAEGIAEFGISAELLKELDSITATASLDGYASMDSLISGLRPRPASDPHIHPIALRKKHTNQGLSPYGPGGLWRLRKDYPRKGDGLNAVSGNPNNSASPGNFSFEHTTGIVTKFAFDTPPDVLAWGSNYILKITGISLTPADASDQTMAKIEIGPSPRLRSKWVGPSGKNIRHDSSVATSDTVTFVFDPKEGTEFNIYFCVVHTPTTCFMYSYEPYPN